MAKLIDTCCREAEIYKKCNLDGVMIENMHDIPYVRSRDIGPEIVSSMTKICSEVRKLMPAKTPCGVQVLAGGNKEALAVAKASSLQFIRAEGYVFSHVADEGLIEASAGQLLRYRKYINAEEVLIFSDIKKKHSSHAITSDVSIEETAKAAEFFLSDGVIITGLATGCPADIQQVESVKRIVGIPVIIGSGVDSKNFKNYIQADGFIIGSYFKKFGRYIVDKYKSFATYFNYSFYSITSLKKTTI
ncbi:hypothetical protein AAG570_012228 [Ranatra chinensis]|uniref:Uncharacterized protein n=1 Tax=Ranatra chinensis TaxID=642074 RepID=A0ABD0YWN7_9HEMI